MTDGYRDIKAFTTEDKMECSRTTEHATTVSTISDGRFTVPNEDSANCGYNVNKGGSMVPLCESTVPNGDSNAPYNECTVPDGGWGWVVTFASFMQNFLMDGVMHTFGIFFNTFLQHFGGSKGKTQMLGSVIWGFQLLVGPFVGAIVHRFQYRRVAIVGAVVASLGLFLSTFSPNLDVLILLYSVVGGTGFGLIYVPSIVIVSNYFNRRRALAMGIAVCGSGIGGFIFAPLSVLLLEVYTWQGAIWIIAAIVLNGAVFAATFRPVEMPDRRLQVQTELHGGTENIDNCNCSSLRQTLGISMLSSPCVVVYLVSCFLVSAGLYIPFHFLPAYANELHLSASEGALLISIIDIFNTLLRVVIGLVLYRHWGDCIMINGVALVLGGVATFCVPYYTSFGALAVYSAVVGSVIGTFTLLWSTILISIKGINQLSTGFGLLGFFNGIAVIIGSPIAGFLSDMTGDFSIVFYLAGAIVALGGSLCLPLRRIVRWELHKQKSSTLGATVTEDTHL